MKSSEEEVTISCVNKAVAIKESIQASKQIVPTQVPLECRESHASCKWQKIKFQFSITATRATSLQITLIKIFLLVDEMSDDLDVADELAVIEYVSNPKNKKCSPTLE